MNSWILLQDPHGPSALRAPATLPHLSPPYAIPPTLVAPQLQQHFPLLLHIQIQ